VLRLVSLVLGVGRIVVRLRHRSVLEQLRRSLEVGLALGERRLRADQRVAVLALADAREHGAAPHKIAVLHVPPAAVGPAHLQQLLDVPTDLERHVHLDVRRDARRIAQSSRVVSPRYFLDGDGERWGRRRGVAVAAAGGRRHQQKPSSERSHGEGSSGTHGKSSQRGAGVVPAVR
jgi:hypothetical protein